MNIRTKKAFSIFMCLLFFIATIGEYGSVNAFAADQPAISFEVGGNGTGSVQYKIYGENWIDSGNIYEGDVSDNDVIYLRAIPNSGCVLDSHDCQQNVRYSGVDHFIESTSFDALAAGTYYFSYDQVYSPYKVSIKFDNAGGPGPGPGPGPGGNVEAGHYKVHVEQQVDGRTGKVRIEFYNSSDVFIESKEYTADSEEIGFPASTSWIKVTVPDSGDILNNARLENVSDRREDDLIDDIRYQEWSRQNINLEKGYDLKITFSNTMSVSWSYDSSAAWDQYVEHATIELLNSDNPTDFTDPGRTDWQLTAGETYYFLLVPEYGYQIVGLNINGQPIAPKDAVGVFEFQMIHSNFHFQGIVAECPDFAEYVPDGLIGGMNVDANGAVDSGNVLVTETEVANDSNALNAVADASAAMVGTIDLSLDQVISKGDGTFWETELSEVDKPVKISLVLPAGELAEGQTYSIIRNHNGVYEELQAVYNKDTEMLEFATDKFSQYTIITKSGTPATGIPEETPSKQHSVEAVPSVSAELPDGTKIESWNDVAKVLQSGSASISNDLLQLTITPSAPQVPANAFEALSKSNSSGLHFFTGEGTALTFANDGNIASQVSINLLAESTDAPGLKTIAFKSFDVLTATVLMHSVVPVGTKQVVIYYTGKDGVRIPLYILEPNEFGRFCFPIVQLGKFEFEY